MGIKTEGRPAMQVLDDVEKYVDKQPGSSPTWSGRDE